MSQIDIIEDNELLNDKHYAEFELDAIKVKGNNTSTLDCSFKHSTLNVAHGDAVQLIPKVNGKSNQQFALALMDNTLISGCDVDAQNTDLQGIFASDGLFTNLHLTDNTVYTKHHGITINGMLSGSILDNDAVIRLYCARIGGWRKLYVLSFLDLEYEPIKSNQDIEDYRGEMHDPNAEYLENFRYHEYREAALKIPNGDGNAVAKAAYDLALLYGDLVMNQKEEELLLEYYLGEIGQELIVEAEGFETRKYLDLGTQGRLSIGIGHLLTNEEKMTGILIIGDKQIAYDERPLTEQEVWDLFYQDVDSRIISINKLISDNNIDLKQHQFDVLFDFYFNVGHKQFVGSSVWKRVLTGNMKGVPEAMSWWNKATNNAGKKVVVEGLVRRRARAKSAWLGGGFKKPQAKRRYDKVNDDSVLGRTEEENQMTKELQVEYHEKERDSDTIKGIQHSLAAAMATILIAKFGIPEAAESIITENFATIIGAGLTAFFSYSARAGRLKAKKQFRGK